MNPPAPLLAVRDLRVHFPVRQHSFRRVQAQLKAVDGVSFELEAGRTLGLVGESGCGKTTLARALVRLIEPNSGSIIFEGQDLTRLDSAALRPLRRVFQMVFQDPYTSLDPHLPIGESIGEALDIHGLAGTRAARRDRISGLLNAVGLDPASAGRYAHEFSGGQRQRIGIARALAVEPRLLVCDEPVSALDVSVQAQIVNLLSDLQQQRGLACLLIAHDLAVVEHLSQQVLVMYLGKIVEAAEARSVVKAPKHPYTQALISAVPTLDVTTQRRRIVLAGEIPSPLAPPGGCPFHPRCPIAEARCHSEVPLLRQVEPGHWAACHLAEETVREGGAVDG